MDRDRPIRVAALRPPPRNEGWHAAQKAAVEISDRAARLSRRARRPFPLSSMVILCVK
jgi:hypothetical protein